MMIFARMLTVIVLIFAGAYWWVNRDMPDELLALVTAVLAWWIPDPGQLDNQD